MGADQAALPGPALMQMCAGYVPAQILRAAAELGVADILDRGVSECESAAKEIGVQAAALRRLLRAMVGLGLVRQLDAGRFALAGPGRPLLRGEPGSVRDSILLATEPSVWRAWGELPRIVRTGEPAYDPATGLTAYQEALREPRTAAVYRAAKAQATTAFAAALTTVCDFSRFGTVAALGGDEGILIGAVLTAAPRLRGVLYEQPDAVAPALAFLSAAGVAHRCDIVPGDGSPGRSVDAYLLNNVLRDQTDERAEELLRRCAAALAPGGRLLAIETLMPAVLTAEHAASFGLTDLSNLVYTGAGERTGAEYGRLLAAAGFGDVMMTSVPAADGSPDYHLIEATPSGPAPPREAADKN